MKQSMRENIRGFCSSKPKIVSFCFIKTTLEDRLIHAQEEDCAEFENGT